MGEDFVSSEHPTVPRDGAVTLPARPENLPINPRETALIGQTARYHRKGTPGMREFEPLAEPGDEALLNRCAAVLRLAEQLERARDQSVRATRVEVRDGDVELQLEADEDVRVARWAAEKQRDVFERAFGRGLVVRDPKSLT